MKPRHHALKLHTLASQVLALVAWWCSSAPALAATLSESRSGADFATAVISRAGTWRFQLDARNEGKEARWFGTALADKIKLPGTTEETRNGERNLKRERKRFTRVYRSMAAWSPFRRAIANSC